MYRKYPDRKDFNLPPSLPHTHIHWLCDFSEFWNHCLMMVIFGVCLEEHVAIWKTLQLSYQKSIKKQKLWFRCAWTPFL